VNALDSTWRDESDPPACGGSVADGWRNRLSSMRPRRSPSCIGVAGVFVVAVAIACTDRHAARRVPPPAELENTASCGRDCAALRVDNPRRLGLTRKLGPIDFLDCPKSIEEIGDYVTKITDRWGGHWKVFPDEVPENGAIISVQDRIAFLVNETGLVEVADPTIRTGAGLSLGDRMFDLVRRLPDATCTMRADLDEVECVSPRDPEISYIFELDHTVPPQALATTIPAAHLSPSLMIGAILWTPQAGWGIDLTTLRVPPLSTSRRPRSRCR